MDFYSAPQPVYNPPIPYTGPIPGGLQDGKMIMIKGRVLPHTDRFHVNLQCGLTEHHCDVAFHFNPRFECPDYVVCNTFENQSWCSEERTYEMPMQKGATFQLLILVQNDSYKVAVNDQHFLEFKHRIPISRVDTISISGQLEVVSLSFINNHIQPVAPAGNANNAGSMFASPAPANLAGSMFAPPVITNPPIPYTGPIPGGLQDGKMIMIKGRVLPHTDRFHVNLQCGLTEHHCDVAFHFNPRFECPDYVVCNTFENQSWCSEERTNEMPMQKGATFQLLILVQNDSYKVAVNDQHFLEFKHRIPISRVDTISISGQLEVVSLSFINNHIQPAAPAGNANNFNPGFPGFPSSAYPIGNACPAGSMFASPAPANLAGSMFAPPAFANPAGSLFPAPAFPSGMIAPQVPYKAPIPGGLFMSRSIVIQGTVKPDSDNFFINLKPSNSTDIAFHISPRFRSENAVVRNSCIQSAWGTEERSLAENPFSPGQLFEITILCEANCFRVSVNGRHVFDFNHRYQPVQQINELQIEGDLTLSSVRT